MGCPSPRSPRRTVAPHTGRVGIVAESAHLAGTIRCQKEETRTYIIDNLKRVAQGVAYATGTECDIQVKRGVLGLCNDNDMVDYARSVMDHVVGKDHQIELPHPMMGAEDFSYYAKEFPAAFYWLGTRNEQKGCTALLHNAHFNFDESVMQTGMELFCALAVNLK